MRVGGVTIVECCGCALPKKNTELTLWMHRFLSEILCFFFLSFHVIYAQHVGNSSIKNVSSWNPFTNKLIHKKTHTQRMIKTVNYLALLHHSWNSWWIEFESRQHKHHQTRRDPIETMVPNERHNTHGQLSPFCLNSDIFFPGHFGINIKIITIFQTWKLLFDPTFKKKSKNLLFFFHCVTFLSGR